MDLQPLYPWLVLTHILGVLGFFMTHGVSAAVLFRLRRERHREKIRTLLDLSAASQNVLGIFLAVFFVSGVLAGFLGPNWWTYGRLWLWVSLGVFVVVMTLMTMVAARFFNEVRRAVGDPTTREKELPADAPAPVDDATLERLLSSQAPLRAAAIGIGGLVVITYLLVIKPF
jgi:hypothetical protein